MGDELVNMGATTYHTLLSVFEEVAIKPGDETWLLASNGGALIQDAATLRDRFAAIPGAAAVYPPEAVLDLFPADRIAFQREHYQQAVAADTGDLLLNSDQRPRALLHSLLFAAREAGAAGGWTPSLRAFATIGAPLVPFVIGFLVVLRLVFLVVGSRRYGVGPAPRGQAFDWYVVVAGAGAASMALSIILMFMYQARYGSLFLNVGLVSALFMVGLAVGGGLCERLVRESRIVPLQLLLITLLIHLGLLLLVHATSMAWPEWLFGGLFLGAGLLGGVYLPLAAAVLKAEGFADQAAGGGLAWSDDLGGAVAGTLTGLVLLPVFGSGYALALLAWLLLALLVPFCVRAKVAELGQVERWTRPVGYALFGIAGVMMCCSVLLARAGTRDVNVLLNMALQEMAPNEEFDLRSKPIAHFAGEGGYCFATDGLKDQASGYGGPITLAVLTDREGELRDVRVLLSHETPAYLALVQPWLKGLVGRNLFEPSEPIDGVTGATLTSEGILHTLDEAGLRFAGQAKDVSAKGLSLPDIRVVVLATLAVIALWLRSRPSRRVRRVFLVMVVLVMGLWLNVQYSMAHVLALLGLNLPPVGLNLAFVVIVGVPLLVLFVGNVYCGYLCPFGAIQELIGDLRPVRIRVGPDSTVWRWGRQVKWVMLFLLVVLFALGQNDELSAIDPLVKVFRHDAGGTFAWVVIAILLLSFVYPRFWCRNLCPTGAFLSLLNGVKVLRRFLPPVTHKMCSFGVTGKHELDCLTCDRCSRVTGRERQQLVPPSPKTAGLRNLVFAGVVALFALHTFNEAYCTWQTAPSSVSIWQADTAHGEARVVDMRKLQWRIEQGQLSDHEALYYGPVGASSDTNVVPVN